MTKLTPSAPLEEPSSVEAEIDLTNPSSTSSSTNLPPTATAFVDPTPHNGATIANLPVATTPTIVVPPNNTNTVLIGGQGLTGTTNAMNGNQPTSTQPLYGNPNLVGGSGASNVPQPFQIEPYNTTNNATSTDVPMHLQSKIGSKCCGCCCDFRRAVIILNIIFICFYIISLINLLLFNPAAELAYIGNAVGYGYDLNNNQEEELNQIFYDLFLADVIISGIGLLASAIPMVGAIKFQWGMVAFGIVWLLGTFITLIVLVEISMIRASTILNETFVSPITSYIVDATLTALFIYPHAGLLIEIKQGIMTAETYPREEYSCCCTSPPPPRPSPQRYNYGYHSSSPQPTAVAVPVERDV